jgi:hypothetical protein
MKMVKSLLLGSAAGLVAVAGAQAADLPVKAKPVEYVKICTLYGEGFYYIPGSDTCIKLGGYVRADYGWNVAGGRTPAYSGTQGAQDRTVASYSTRHRANIQLDTRTQTAYGTLRTFTSLHFQNEDNAFSNNTARAFIQWAGFTFGHAQSFQDTWGITDSWHFAQQQNNSDTGANGVNQIAYTWELGNGMTLTVGADERRSKSLTNLSANNAIRIGAEPLTSAEGQKFPDGHIDFKINQAWGYFAATGVVHDASASYYNSNVAANSVCAGSGSSNAAIPNTLCGHPDSELGWAAEFGMEIKLPQFGPQDRFGAGARYAQGASAFGGGSNLASPSLFGSGNVLAVGQMTDAVYLNGGQIDLTTTWTVQAGYEHSWTPTLKSSFTAGYTSVQYDDRAKGMYATNVCAGFTTAAGGPGQAGINNAGGTSLGRTAGSCDPDWQFLQGGIRTMWTPVPGFILGVDVFYTQVWTAFKGQSATLNGVNVSGTSGATTLINPVAGARPAGIYTFDDEHSIGAVFRAQRNFNAGD